MFKLITYIYLNTKITPSCFIRKYTKKATPRELWYVPRLDKNRIQCEQKCERVTRLVVAWWRPTAHSATRREKKCVQKINECVSSLDVEEENVIAFIKR